MIIKTKRASADGWCYLDPVHDPTISRVRFWNDLPPEGIFDRDCPVLLHLDLDPKEYNLNIDLVQCEMRMRALSALAASATDSHRLALIVADQRTEPHAWLIEYIDQDGNRQKLLTDQDTYLMSASGQTVDKYKGPWTLPAKEVSGPDGVIPKKMAKTGEKVAVGGDPKEERKNTSPEDVKSYFGTKPSPSEAVKGEKEGPGHSMLPGDEDQ